MARPSIVFTDVTAARKFRDDLNTAFGYPRPNVVVRGGAPATTGQTTGYASLLKHPTLNQWAFPDDPLIKGKRGQVPMPGGSSQVDLDADSTWDAAQPASLVKPQLE
jgi:hypothetical protein